MTTVGSTYTNRSRAKRVAAGLCGFCGNPRDQWKFLCNFCQEKHRLRQRKTANPAADQASRIIEKRSRQSITATTA